MMAATYWNLRMSCTAERKSSLLRTSARELNPTTSLVHLVTMGQKGCRLGRDLCLSSLQCFLRVSLFTTI